MRSAPQGDRGSVTAEFAVVIPAVLLILAGCLGAVQVVGQQLRLTDAASDGARALARGDGIADSQRIVRRSVSGVHISTEQKGDFSCLTVTAPAGFTPAAALGLTVSAHACALTSVP